MAAGDQAVGCGAASAAGADAVRARRPALLPERWRQDGGSSQAGKSGFVILMLMESLCTCNFVPHCLPCTACTLLLSFHYKKIEVEPLRRSLQKPEQAWHQKQDCQPAMEEHTLKRSLAALLLSLAGRQSESKNSAV